MAADLKKKLSEVCAAWWWAEEADPCRANRNLSISGFLLTVFGAATYPFASPAASIFQMKNRSKGRSLLMKMNSGRKRRHQLFDEASE